MIVAETINTVLGSLPAWLTLIAVAIVGYFFVRGAGGTALSTLETANRILEGRVHDLEAQAKADAKLIATLTARTDLSVQLAPLIAWTGQHELRAQERFEKTIKVLGEIADRLAPDTGSGLKLPA